MFASLSCGRESDLFLNRSISCLHRCVTFAPRNVTGSQERTGRQGAGYSNPHTFTRLTLTGSDDQTAMFSGIRIRSDLVIIRRMAYIEIDLNGWKELGTSAVDIKTRLRRLSTVGKHQCRTTNVPPTATTGIHTSTNTQSRISALPAVNSDCAINSLRVE